MRELTGSTRIRVRASRQAPARKPLTGDTRIRLSQIKDLAAWIEDRRYEIGEISTKTGLMKTAEGWVVPPHAMRHQEQEQPQRKGLHGGGRAYSTDYKKNREVMHARGKELISRMTASVKSAFSHYIGMGSGIMNKIQRRQITNVAGFQKEIKEIKEMENFMAQDDCTAGHNITVYRNTTADTKTLNAIFPLDQPINSYPEDQRTEILQSLIGKEIPQAAFTSTTINPKNIHGWNEEEKNTGMVTYKLRVPAEAHGLYVAPMAKGQNENEEEFLLQNKQTFIYTQINYDKKSGDYNIIADVLVEAKK